MGPVTKIDLNGDGTLDQIDIALVEPPKTPGDACGGGLQFDVHPAVENTAQKLITMPTAPKGLKRFHDGMMDFSFTDPSTPVFQPGGLLSVRKGQVLGEVVNGKVTKTFTVDGLALGITRHQLDKLYRGSYEKPVDYNALTWRAYTLNGANVRDEINLKNAVWIVNGNAPINPNIILTTSSLSPAEEKLKDLFKEADTLKKLPEDQRFDKLTTAIKKYRAKLPKEITSEPLWTGIQMALAKLAGISPADL